MNQEIRPLSFGNLSIWPPVAAAPMAGYTDSVYRGILRELGCPYCVTEMISSKGLVQGGQNTWFLLEHSPCDRPLAVQLFGEDPDHMFLAAQKIHSLGLEFEALDINMGCPARKITSQGAGGALLKDVSRAMQIVSAVKAASSLPVSVKMRTGWADSCNATRIAGCLCQAGADMLVVHGRNVAQGYGGKADWGVISQIASSVDIPVVGNGDIGSPEEAICKLTNSGCSGVMIGRGLLGNPFFFQRLIALLDGLQPMKTTGQERIKMAMGHLSRSVKRYGEYHALREMKKHLLFYFKGMKGAPKMRESVNHAGSTGEIIDVLKKASKEMASS